jgi:hypothetical protein
MQEGILAGRQADLLLFSPPKSLSFRRTGNQLSVTSSKIGTANVTSKMINLRSLIINFSFIEQAKYYPCDPSNKNKNWM